MAEWKMTSIDVRREYEVAGVPDLQDTSSVRRMVIRPRKVIVHQMYGTSLVRGATVEGRQVRLDGQLAGGRMVLVGRCGYYDAAPPAWLFDLVAAEGLEWATDDAARANAA